MHNGLYTRTCIYFICIQYDCRAVDISLTGNIVVLDLAGLSRGGLAAAANVMNSRFIQIWIDVHTITLLASVNHECGPRLWVDWSSERTPHFYWFRSTTWKVHTRRLTGNHTVYYRRKAVYLNKYMSIKAFKNSELLLFFFWSIILMIFPCYW